MSLVLDCLPERGGSAATQMATDFLLLQHYPQPAHARFRHYSWHRPAATFGYSQKIAWVRENLPAHDSPLELCRRPSGGGIVDHRDDWTYALVIPRDHSLGDQRAVVIYEAVHRALASALQQQGCPAGVKEACEPCGDGTRTGPGVCFERAELFDVIRADDQRKVAGAAQKRSKHGLLLQGSVQRSAAPEVDLANWQDEFIDSLATLLQATPQTAGWPGDWDQPIDDLAEAYTTPEWNERR